MTRALALAALLLPLSAQAQREGLLQIGSPLSDFVERQATAGRLPQAAADALPLSAAVAGQLLDSLAARLPPGGGGLSPADRALLDRYQTPTPATLFGRPVPFGAYADGASATRVEGDGYAFELAPLLDVALGPANRTGDADGAALRATRGIRAAGRLGRLYLETRATENEVRPLIPQIDNARRTAPRVGFIKPTGPDTYDYFQAEGAVGYHDRFVDVRFARERNRWGAGTGTLFLSNYAAPYDHLRVAAAAGPVSYTMLVARLTTPDRQRGANVVLPSKYAAFHRFALEVGRVQLEAFEAVVFHDDTLNGNRRGLEIGYLNPVIFYRAVESEIGSGDNALIGLGAAVRPVDGVRLYGQVLIDEFRLEDIGDDVWTNKWGLLAGVHAVDVGLPGLEVRAEAARMRPYLYGHRSISSAYVHYDDILGHPVGPNAQDLSLYLRYRPSVKTTARLLAARTLRGRDPDGVYVGQDPRVPYGERISNEAPTFDGVRQTEWLVEGALGYEVLPRLVLEAAGRYEAIDDAQDGRTRGAAATFGIRWELPFRSARY